MQPALVLAALALATIVMSSQMELGSAGREKARHLGQSANSLLQAALNDGSTDPTLAQAFLVSASAESLDDLTKTSSRC